MAGEILLKFGMLPALPGRKLLKNCFCFSKRLYVSLSVIITFSFFLVTAHWYGFYAPPA